MGKWTKRILIALGVLIALAAAAYWWLVMESGTPSGTYALDIAEVRKLADSIPGEKAREIRVENPTAFAFPSTAVVAGDGWAATPMPVFSYQLAFADKTAIVDTAMGEAEARKNGVAFYDQASFARIGAALKSASLILITHEHSDHIGGLLAQPGLKSELAATRLNAEQLESAKASAPAVFAGYKPVAYGKYLAVAPGVVLIRAPGHTAGSQMVYVKTQGGAEFLFLGDVAWHMRNVDTMRERARLVTQFYIVEDRDAVLAQLAALGALKKAEPALHMVPGHDGEAVAALEKDGLLAKQFP